MLGLESARMDEQRRKKAWVKTGDPYPFIKTVKECAPPHLPLEISYFPSASVNGAGWVTHAHIDEDPVIGGHDLCFDKTCQRNRLATCAEAGCKKRFE